MTIHTKAENETKREKGETALFSLWNSSGVLAQFKPQTLTAASVAEPLPFKSGLRPLHDRAQTPKTRTLSDWEAFGAAVQSFGASVAEKVIDRAANKSGRDVSHLRPDLSAAAQSGALKWFSFASVVFGPDAFRRFLGYSIETQKPVLLVPYKPQTRTRKQKDGTVKEFTRNRYSLRRAAHKECDRLLSRMANRREVVTAYLDETTSAEMAEPVSITRETVAERCAILRERIEAKAETGNNRTKGAAKTHLKTVDRLHAYLLASIDGRTYAADDALRFACETRETAKERLTIRKNGRIVSNDGKGSATGSRSVKTAGKVNATCPAYEKVRQFADFVGVRFDRDVNGFAVLFGELGNVKPSRVGAVRDGFAKVSPDVRKVQTVATGSATVSRVYGGTAPAWHGGAVPLPSADAAENEKAKRDAIGERAWFKRVAKRLAKRKRAGRSVRFL